MVKVTEDMKELIGRGLAFGGTADGNGRPNIKIERLYIARFLKNG